MEKQKTGFPTENGLFSQAARFGRRRRVEMLKWF
jgi:hypothetical protein